MQEQQTLKKILVIDDNEAYRADLLEILNFENYTTLEAENGQVGWPMIHEHSPNLVICDVDMPVMSGLEVLKRAKSHALFASIPFVLVSARSDAQTLKAARDLGVKHYLTKPISISGFLSTIFNILNTNLTATAGIDSIV